MSSKHWFQSKTVLLNVALIIVAYWFEHSAFYVNPRVFVWSIAAANIGLRLVTRRPIALRRTS